jgi:transposase
VLLLGPGIKPGLGVQWVRVAIVALARKLLIAFWRFATDGEIPEGAELKIA